mgnify:FL=1
MTPAQWNALLAPAVPAIEAYKSVEEAARLHLSMNPLFTEVGITTNELVEALYPEALARGDGVLARARIYKALAALATRGLADCATRGQPRKLKHMNKTVRPWLWHEPGEKNPEAQDGVKRCPHCNGELR